MLDIDENSSFYIEDYKTLHHDIGLFQRTNGLWDLWFGQDEVSERYKNTAYLNIVEGDLVSATEVHSLQVGIIISCLTSWNYLNRTGNPIYAKFGNEAYSLLKKNKGINTEYKLKQFFIDCLERMRRVYSVEYLEVFEINTNPYLYKVRFKVLSVTNTLVDGEFYLNTDSSKNTSTIEVNYNHPYTSVANPLNIECILKNEYGSSINGEIIYIYIKNSSDSKFKFKGITEATNDDGKVFIMIPPNGLDVNTQIMLVFKGNDLYNPSSSKIIQIQNVAYYIKSKYTYKTVQDNNGDDVEVIDKHILYVEDSLGNSLSKFRLGELLSDYVLIENFDSLHSSLSLQDLEENAKNENSVLEYDENEKNKLYLIPLSNTYVNGTNKPKYKAYCWNDEGNQLILTSYDVQLNTNRPYEVHFLINDEDNGLFEIDFGDGHLYYQIDLLDN